MNKTWTTRDGREIKISEMTTQHLKNAISYLERKDRTTWKFGSYGSLAEDMYYDEVPNEEYENLVEELNRRGREEGEK